MTERIWDDPQITQWITAHHPFKGIGRPQDIANAALFLASEDNTWLTGACVPVDGGYTAM
jgi:NAD(P)-dependent dehydrogenase (short-subunit alcohol dehydrogenase family)